MKKMRVTIAGLDALSAVAKEIIDHVEAIKELQSKISPCSGIDVEICIENGKEE